MKYGVCAWSLPMREADCFSYAKEIGLDGITIDVAGFENDIPLLDKAMQEEYLRLSQINNIEISALAVNGLCAHGMSNIEKYDRVKYLLESAVEIAQNMKISVLQVPSFGDGEIHTEAQLEQTIRCLQYGVSLLQGTDIKLGHENALSYNDNIKIMKAINNSAYFTYFDTQNPVRFGNNSNPDILARELMPHIKQMHVKDSYDDITIPLQLGEGNTYFKETMQVFKDKNYDGWVIMESEYKAYADYDAIIRKDLKILKELFVK